MFSNLLNLFQKPTRLTQFGTDLQNWEESTNYNCLIVMTGGNFYLGSRYLDIYQVGWKYYFPGLLEGKWVSYQLPYRAYQLELPNNSGICVFEKYNEICPGEENTMFAQEYRGEAGKDMGPIIFVKTNGKWTREEVEQILL